MASEAVEEASCRCLCHLFPGRRTGLCLGPFMLPPPLACQPWLDWSTCAAATGQGRDSQQMAGVFSIP